MVKSHGQFSGDQVLKKVYQCLSDRVHKNKFTHIEPLWDDAFIIIAPAEIDLMSWLSDIEQTPFILENGSIHHISFHAGVSWLSQWTGQHNDFIYLLYKALIHAASIGKSNTGIIDGKLAQSFELIVSENLITPYYQPIISLQNNIPLGYEALSRGPSDHPLHMPGPLFDYAYRMGQLLELEQVCRRAAIYNATIQNQEYLFLNINPQTLNDPSFVKGKTKEWAAAKGFSPSQIVFEITEHEAIADYDTFRKTVNHYRDQGFLIAIDDTGSGYSGLLTLVELNPDFIKLDRGLIADINFSPSKQAMVEAMVMVAKKIHARTIAEGIETEKELATVKSLGIDFGQGFYMGRPEPFPAAPIFNFQ